MQNTQVIMIGVAHQWHGESKICSYEHIFNYIKRYSPDVIGVEIRPEDIVHDNNYLKISYPYEMIEVKDRFKDSAKIYGIDWLGYDIENGLLSVEYWKNSEFKKMQRKIRNDDEFKTVREVLNPLDKKLNELIEASDLYQLNSDLPDAICNIFFTQERLLLKGTSCEEYGSFWLERDEKISTNIINVIKENPGAKILFLTGLAHRKFSMNKIKAYFKDNVEIYENIMDYNI